MFLGLLWLLVMLCSVTSAQPVFSWFAGFPDFLFVSTLSFFSWFLWLVLCCVGLGVFLFSGDYVRPDKRSGEFSLIFLWFVGSMILLVVADTLWVTFSGWEGLGASSYLLVLHYRSGYAISASCKVVVMNRLGDVFLGFVVCVGFVFGADAMVLFLSVFSSHPPCFGGLDIPFVLACVVLAGFANSAIFPFSPWLPAAMGAPTPVSALVHSSTLVLAGLWLLFSLVDVCLFVFVVLGGATMLIGGLFAIFEADLNNVVAHSTLSQLGFLVFSLGCISKLAVFFHMLSHAFCKSALFVCVGYGILLSSHGQQANLVRLGGALMLRLYVSVALLSLSGGMFLSGFFTKHQLLFFLKFDSLAAFGLLAVWLIGCVATSLYSLRVVSLLSSPSLLTVASSFSLGLVFLLVGCFCPGCFFVCFSPVPLGGEYCVVSWLWLLGTGLFLIFSFGSGFEAFIGAQVVFVGNLSDLLVRGFSALRSVLELGLLEAVPVMLARLGFSLVSVVDFLGSFLVCGSVFVLFFLF